MSVDPKKLRADHRALATRIINQLEADRTADKGVTLDRLQQSKLMLQEKLDTLNARNISACRR